MFLLIAPSIVLYSQGYRIDFENKKITQTGGLFLKISPKQADIYLNGKLSRKTDFFFGSALIENLLPKKYKLEIKKTGYQSWEKTLEVTKKEVTEAKNVILLPEDLNLNSLSKGVKNFWLSPDEKKLALEELDEAGWSLKLYDLDKNVKSHLISEGNIYSKGADLLNLEFSKDSKEIYLNVAIKEAEKNFTLKLDKTPPTLTERKIATTSENIIASKTIDNDAFYLDKSGYILREEETITEKPFPIQKETEYLLEVFANFIFLKEGENLYLLNPESKSFEKFFSGIKDLKLSPDSKTLVYLSDNEIWLLFLKDEFDQPQRKAGEKLFLMRLSEKINDIFWLNNHYLIFVSGDQIKITETDNRDKINIVDIVEIKNPRIFWNQLDKKIYLLSEENLYSSPVLLP